MGTGDTIVAELNELIPRFESMKTMMEEHLGEEEEIGIPLFRSAFTPKEGT
jgi:hypothetical protein